MCSLLFQNISCCGAAASSAGSRSLQSTHHCRYLSLSTFCIACTAGVDYDTAVNSCDFTACTAAHAAAVRRYLFNLQKARFTNTSMACSGIIRPYNITTNASCSNPDYCKTPQTFGDNATAQMFCSDEQVLPCFLRFSDEQLPLDDASNMRCRCVCFCYKGGKIYWLAIHSNQANLMVRLTLMPACCRLACMHGQPTGSIRKSLGRGEGHS
jgi:hypothetical protein